MIRQAQAMCRSCGHEQIVRFGEDRTTEAGFFFPDHCLRCESDDLIPLSELSKDDVEEIYACLANAEGRVPHVVEYVSRLLEDEDDSFLTVAWRRRIALLWAFGLYIIVLGVMVRRHASAVAGAVAGGTYATVVMGIYNRWPA